MATADEIRRLREETSIFSRLFDLARQQGERLEQEGRRPVLGGLLSKEPVMGTDTIRYEGITPLLLNLIEPIARGIDAPRAAYQGLIPQEDMIGEAFGTAGTAMIGGGLAAGRSVLDYDPLTTRAFFGRDGGSIEDALELSRSGKGIFHSSQADQFDEINKYGVEPQYGPWVKEIAAGATDDLSFLDEMPMAAWWSEQPDWVKMKTSRAAGKNVNDVTVDDIRKYGHLSIADADDYADTVYRIPEEGIDYEGSEVSNLAGEKMPLYASDLYEHGDDGVGRYPFGIERNELVTRESVEPKYSLTGQDLVDFLEQYDGNTVSANASKSTGLLTVASDVSARGDQILNMLKSGRADDITDSMFDMRDPVKNTQLNQYLFENYDLPMDEASRMARAREMGFDVDKDLYHGTAPSMYSDDKFSPNIDAFRVSKKGQLGSGVYATTDMRKANTFSNASEANRGDFNLLNPSPRGGSILPIIAKNENPASFRQMRNAQYQLGDVSDFNDLSQRGTQELLDQGFTSVRSGNEINIFDPANIRSRFARFDPRLSHLSNLTAANASPISGILAQSGVSENQAQRIEDYLRKRGLLD